MPDITGTIRLSMAEKLAWAQRSLDGMKAAKDGNAVLVQDHFWTFLHASHLLWFYFGKWVRESGAKKTAANLLKEWQDRRLTPDELAAWDSLASLRNEDVHVQPVMAEKPRGAGIMVSKEGKIMVCKHGIMVSKEKPYRVKQGGVELELFALCEAGMRALCKFVDEFDKIT